MTNLLGEFMGTMVLISFGGGAVANSILSDSKGYGGGWMCITTGWAFGLMLGVFTCVALGAPQGDLNPVVTMAKTLMGVYTVSNALATMAVQFVGAFMGGVVVWLAFLPHWERTQEPAAKLAVFSTGPAIKNTVGNFICEVIATFFLVFLIFMIFNTNNGTFPPGYGPYMVAALLWGLGLSFGGPTGYAMNPARDLGPRIAHFVLPIAGKGDSNWAYSWIPVVAPIVGSLLAYTVAKVFGAI